jgi:hypothetical protein
VIGFGIMVQDSADIFQKGEVKLQYISIDDHIVDFDGALVQGKVFILQGQVGACGNYSLG